MPFLKWATSRWTSTVVSPLLAKVDISEEFRHRTPLSPPYIFFANFKNFPNVNSREHYIGLMYASASVIRKGHPPQGYPLTDTLPAYFAYSWGSRDPGPLHPDPKASPSQPLLRAITTFQKLTTVDHSWSPWIMARSNAPSYKVLPDDRSQIFAFRILA